MRRPPEVGTATAVQEEMTSETELSGPRDRWKLENCFLPGRLWRVPPWPQGTGAFWHVVAGCESEAARASRDFAGISDFLEEDWLGVPLAMTIEHFRLLLVVQRRTHPFIGLGGNLARAEVSAPPCCCKCVEVWQNDRFAKEDGGV